MCVSCVLPCLSVCLCVISWSLGYLFRHRVNSNVKFLLKTSGYKPKMRNVSVDVLLESDDDDDDDERMNFYV